MFFRLVTYEAVMHSDRVKAMPFQHVYYARITSIFLESFFGDTLQNSIRAIGDPTLVTAKKAKALGQAISKAQAYAR